MSLHPSSGHRPRWRTVVVEIPGSYFLPTLSLRRLFLTLPWEPQDVWRGSLSSRRRPLIITAINQCRNQEMQRMGSLDWKTLQDRYLGAFPPQKNLNSIVSF